MEGKTSCFVFAHPSPSTPRQRKATPASSPKTPITAADLLNDRVVPFFDEQEITLQRVLTDRGTEFCGSHDKHEYELYLAVENIDHSRTKTKSPQTNGICERFHKTVLDEFYRVAFRKKIYESLEELQADLDEWMRYYNEVRPHRGRWCFGKTPIRPSATACPWRGVEAAVLVPIAEWRRLERMAQPTLKDLLLAPGARAENKTLSRCRPGGAGQTISQYDRQF